MYQKTISPFGFTHSPIDIHSHLNHESPYDCSENEINVCGTFTINAVFKCYTESSAVFAELRLSKKLLYRKYDMDK